MIGLRATCPSDHTRPEYFRVVLCLSRPWTVKWQGQLGRIIERSTGIVVLGMGELPVQAAFFPNDLQKVYT